MKPTSPASRPQRVAAVHIFLGVLAVLALAGCATRPPTPKLESYHPQKGYYGPKLERPDNSPELVFLMALSGGGTRAASLSYGVLKELAATPSPRHGPRTLLQEIDGISSVSGGSVTAAAYALYGDKLFTEFEGRFLKRDVQGVLLWQTLNPLNWPRLWSGLAGRSDLAADYYDKILFNHATYGDLPRDTRPYIVINATDVSTGARFEFDQAYFDLICGDVSKYSLSRAVAASSAVPVVLSPITLDNHGGECGFETPEWMTKALADNGATSQRAYYRARELKSFGDSHSRPYIHLVDGGVSDNLGLRAILDAMLVKEVEDKATGANDRVERIVILFVNAEHRPKLDWDTKPNPPGTLRLGVKSSSIPMERYSFETVELVRERLEHWKDVAAERRGGKRNLEFYLIEVSFEQVPDKEEQRYLQNLPTSFVLPPEAVDRLRDAGGKLLRDSPEFKRLLSDLATDAPPSEVTGTK
jgi:NTE family protein